jgi:hypothetical protein
MKTKYDLTPEQQLVAQECDQLSDELLIQLQGRNVGVVLGACMNVIRNAATFVPHTYRQELARRLREEFSADIAAMVDEDPGDQPPIQPIPPQVQ